MPALAPAAAAPAARPLPFLRRLLPLVALGLPGVLALAPMLGPQLAAQLAALPPDAPRVDAPLGVVVAAALLQSFLLMAALTAVGTALAPRLGLTSHVLRRVEGGPPVWAALRGELPLALALGVAGAGLLALGDGLTRPLLGEAGEALARAMPRTWRVTLAGVLYGGLSEELIARWGVMSLAAFGLHRLLQRGQGPLRPSAAWPAILFAALVFGAGHLPAVASVTALTPLLVARTVLLNAVAGAICGWLFWRRSLEAAMAAHVTFHVALSAGVLVAGLAS
jgi:hypothetical protein